MILARPRLALFALPVSPPSRRRRVAVAPLAASKKKKKQQPSDVGDSQDPVPVVEPSRTTKKEHWVEDSEDDGPLLDVDAGAKPRSVRGKNKKPVKTTASPAQKRAVTTPYGGRRATRPLRYGAVKIDTTRPTQVPGLVSRGSSWVSINCAFEDFPFDDFVDFVASVDDAVSETMASKVDASAERKDDDLNEDDFL